MRNKDYILRFDEGGAVAEEGNGNAVANRIYTALIIQKGTLVSDYEYGSELHKIKKDAPSASLAAKRYAESALRQIRELEQVFVEVKSQDRLLKIDLKAQANGRYLVNSLSL